MRVAACLSNQTIANWNDCPRRCRSSLCVGSRTLDLYVSPLPPSEAQRQMLLPYLFTIQTECHPLLMHVTVKFVPTHLSQPIRPNKACLVSVCVQVCCDSYQTFLVSAHQELRALLKTRSFYILLISARRENCLPDVKQPFARQSTAHCIRPSFQYYI
jgi:hypothetical protein